MAESAARLIWIAAGRLICAATRQRAALAVSLDLKCSDVLALDYLTSRGELTPTELARLLALSSGGTTAVVDRLAAAGYVARSPGPGRHRRVLLSVTPEGTSATTGALLPLVADVEQLTSRVSPADRHTVETFLACLADIAERHVERLMAEAEYAGTDGPHSPVLWG